MVAHANLRPYLMGIQGKAFVVNLTQLVYNWAEKIPSENYNYKTFFEVTVREDTGEKTRKHLDKKEHFRLDAVMFVEPGYASLNQGSCYTVGLELKNSKEDLLNDKKMEHYIGYTDFFFIGVPQHLTDEALERAGDSLLIGVVDIENGVIVKLPKRIDAPMVNRYALLEQIMFAKVIRGVASENIMINNIDDIEKGECRGALSEEERAARKAAAEARERFRRERAIEVAEKGSELPEPIRIKLNSLPDQVQEAYHIIRANPGINAHGIEGEMSVAEVTAKRFVGELVKQDLIERQGSRKTGGYYVTEKESDGFQYMPKCNNCVVLQGLRESGVQIPQLRFAPLKH